MSEKFTASYSCRDAILYALSIGFGNSMERYEQDLHFLHEDHPHFTAAPTLCLALIFWATQERSKSTIKEDSTLLGLPQFPPPMMTSMGVIPKQSVGNIEDFSIDEYPILHTFQSVTWHRPMPVSKNKRITTCLQGRFVSVLPKSIGTFVTSETDIDLNNGSDQTQRLCTVRSTALILGLTDDSIQPLKEEPKSFNTIATETFNKGNKTLLFDTDCTIAPNTALIYRLASGDSNKIHVDPSSVPLFGDNEDGPRPLLHGLCTLGIVSRVILQFIAEQNLQMSLHHLEGHFAKPVFLNDTLNIQIWTVNHNILKSASYHLCFLVRSKKTDSIFVDKGYAILTSNEQIASRL